MDFASFFDKKNKEKEISELTEKIRKMYLYNDSSNYFIRVCIKSFFQEKNVSLINNNQKHTCCITGKKYIKNKDLQKIMSFVFSVKSEFFEINPNKKTESYNFFKYISKIYSIVDGETIDSRVMYKCNDGTTDKKISRNSILALRNFVNQEIKNKNQEIIDTVNELDEDFQKKKLEKLLEKYKK